jgi:hypothetical protein
MTTLPLLSHNIAFTSRSAMDPFQISVLSILSVGLVCNCCLQLGTHSLLGSLREDGKYIGQHLRDITDKLEKLSKHEIKKPNIFLGTRLDDSPA